MNFDIKKKRFFLVCEGGGGGGEGSGYEHKATIVLHCHDLLYRTVWSHENIPNGIQNKGHCSFNHQGKIIRRYKVESCHSCHSYCQDLFAITVK